MVVLWDLHEQWGLIAPANKVERLHTGQHNSLCKSSLRKDDLPFPKVYFHVEHRNLSMILDASSAYTSKPSRLHLRNL